MDVLPMLEQDSLDLLERYQMTKGQKSIYLKTERPVTKQERKKEMTDCHT